MGHKPAPLKSIPDEKGRDVGFLIPQEDYARMVAAGYKAVVKNNGNHVQIRRLIDDVYAVDYWPSSSSLKTRFDQRAGYAGSFSYVIDEAISIKEQLDAFLVKRNAAMNKPPLPVTATSQAPVALVAEIDMPLFRLTVAALTGGVLQYYSPATLVEKVKTLLALLREPAQPQGSPTPCLPTSSAPSETSTGTASTS